MTTALVVIDVQESFRLQPSWESISLPAIVAQVQRLVAAARKAGNQVVWVLHSAPRSGGPFDPSSGLVTLQPGLTAAPGDITVVKTSHNAFTTTDLAQHLTRLGVHRLRVAGIRTEQCVGTTVRLASDMGYEVELVIDATATHPLPLASGGGVLAAEDVITRTAAALSGRFARITTVEEIVTG